MSLDIGILIVRYTKIFVVFSNYTHCYLQHTYIHKFNVLNVSLALLLPHNGLWVRLMLMLILCEFILYRFLVTFNCSFQSLRNLGKITSASKCIIVIFI